MTRNGHSCKRCLASCVCAVLLSTLVKPAAFSADARPAAAVSGERQAAHQVAAAIRAAHAAGQKKVVIAPRVYRFEPGETQWHMDFSALSDLEIDARGATFEWQGRAEGGIRFTRCRNVTLRGATIRRATPCFTQGTVTAIDAATNSCILTVDTGFPADIDESRWFGDTPTANVFDAKLRQWKARTPDFRCVRIEKLDSQRFRLVCAPSLSEEGVDVGDLLVVQGRCAPEIRIADCSGMSVREVTVENAGGVGVDEEGGGGGGTYSFTLTYGARPESARIDPLVASAAGAFTSRDVRQGPIVEKCFFEGMCGDGIAIGGSYAKVERVDQRELAITRAPAHFSSFRAGKPIAVYEPDGRAVGRAVVQSVALIDETRSIEEVMRHPFASDDRTQLLLTLDGTMDAKRGFLISAPAASGGGFVARSNSIRHHKGCGLRLGAPDGLVEQNFLDGSTVAAVLLAPDFAAMEVGYSRNVVIRKNTIRSAGYATIGPRSALVGAVTIGGGAGLGHEGIRIEANTFLRNAGVNLQIEHARDVVVADNRFLDANQTPCRNGRERGIDSEAIVWMADCRGVRFAGNTYKGRGPFGKQVVGVTETAEFDGLRNGMQLDRY